MGNNKIRKPVPGNFEQPALAPVLDNPRDGQREGLVTSPAHPRACWEQSHCVSAKTHLQVRVPMREDPAPRPALSPSALPAHKSQGAENKVLQTAPEMLPAALVSQNDLTRKLQVLRTARQHGIFPGTASKGPRLKTRQLFWGLVCGIKFPMGPWEGWSPRGGPGCLQGCEQAGGVSEAWVGYDFLGVCVHPGAGVHWRGGS